MNQYVELRESEIVEAIQDYVAKNHSVLTTEVTGIGFIANDDGFGDTNIRAYAWYPKKS